MDPDTGAHTNTIESLWEKFKHDHRNRYGTKRDFLSSYICEFQFKRLFGEDKFYNFWRVAAEQFSVKDKQV